MIQTVAIAAFVGFAAAQQGYAPPPAYTTTASCPAPGTTGSQGYSCNPAHQYPEGQKCELTNGCYILTTVSTPTPSSYQSTPPAYTTTTTPIPTGVPTAETCNCYIKLSDCQTAPDANQSFCASQFASCLGYSPYDMGAATTTFFDNLEKYCTPSSSTSPPAYTTTATPLPTGVPTAETCNCYLKLSDCQTAPNANQAYCASQFASCTNSNPYGQGDATTAYFNNLKKYCIPSSSSAPPAYTTTTTALPTGSPSPDTCACYSKLNACQTAPDANQAFCASQFASCAMVQPYGFGQATTDYFNNLAKYCTPGSSSAPSYSSPVMTMSSPPPVYTKTSTPTGAASGSMPPVYSSSMASMPPASYSAPSATKTGPAVYTGAAAMATGAPLAAAMAFGALFL